MDPNFPLAAPGRISYLTPTQGCGRSSGVEHYLAKVRVVSSNLIARSKKPPNRQAAPGRLFCFCGRATGSRGTMALAAAARQGENHG
jgi:hypothetical protein